MTSYKELGRLKKKQEFLHQQQEQKNCRQEVQKWMETFDPSIFEKDICERCTASKVELEMPSTFPKCMTLIKMLNWDIRDRPKRTIRKGKMTGITFVPIHEYEMDWSCPKAKLALRAYIQQEAPYRWFPNVLYQ